MSIIKVVFVCLGNICRSPMAEGIFRDLVKKANLSETIQIDSAGTSDYHIGSLADARMRQTAASYKIDLVRKARQFTEKDFEGFDYIIVMDHSNRNNIIGLTNVDYSSRIFMMRQFDPELQNGEVPDPYFGGKEGFEEVYRILLRSCQHLLQYIIKEHSL